MSRIKLVLFCGLALCAMLAVVGTSGASAAEFLLEAGKSFPQAFKASSITLSDASLFKSSLLGVKVEIECETVALVSGELASATDSTADIHYTSCKVILPTGCGVHEPIEVSLLGEPTSAEDVKFTPISGPFVTIELTGCSVAGKYEVTGSQTCFVNSGTLAKLHELACEETGSELKFFTSSAKYESEPIDLELASGAEFGQG